MHHFRPLLLAAAACLTGLAAVAADTLTVAVPTGRTVTVTALSDRVLRVANAADSAPAMLESRAAVPGLGQDYHGATVCAPAAPGAFGVLRTPCVTASVDPATGAVTIYGAGSPVRTLYDPGVRVTDSAGMAVTRLYPVGPRQSFYGAGERGHRLDLTGDTLVNYNRPDYGYTGTDPRISQMGITMPLLVSSAGYALVFDDYAASTLAVTDPLEYSTENPRPVAYYYVDGSGTLPGTVEALSSLTGRQPLPPFWALGYVTSKYGYRDAQELTGAIDTLRREGYPVDAAILDLYWYGCEQDMGRLDWDPAQWPAHQEMLRGLKADGVQTVLISQPYVLSNGRGRDNFQLLSQGQMLLTDSTGAATQPVSIWVGEGGMLDPSNPRTRQWLADRYRDLTAQGAGGWWGDLGEPEVHPSTALHHNGLTARQYHNQYGNDWAQIIAEMFSRDFPQDRLMTLMRGGTTGLQRHSVFPWSGDVSRSWGGMEPQVTIMAQAGLSGLGYMGHDVGGFAVDPAAPRDPELYLRWLQLGLFSPMLRTHAQADAEPYHYPEIADATRRLIRERYAWLPYNYTLAWENATAGQPLVRPLGYYASPDSVRLYDAVRDQYLWGRDIMVAPVMAPGDTSRAVVFPSGTWICLDGPDRGRVFRGGTTATVAAPLDVLPLFVRAGAIVPRADYPMDRGTGDYDASRLTVDYYPVPGQESTYTMYEDDRRDPQALQQGRYALLAMTGTQDAQGARTAFTVDIQGTYPGAPATRTITLRVHGLKARPAAVTVDGRRVKEPSSWSWKDGTASVDIPFRAGQTIGQAVIQTR